MALFLRRLLVRDRNLTSYPNTGLRAAYLTIVVLASIVIFYEIYVQGAVSTEIIGAFNIPLWVFVLGSIFGNAVGALAAWGTGIADRWGRANLIVLGSGTAGIIAAFGLPNTHAAGLYIALYAVLSLTGGVVLVATQALVRDFSPQMGRATAMGVWTLGPVLGNLVISVVTHATVDAHPGWRYQYYLAGGAGVVVTVIAYFWLRELSPALRNQVMASMAERELVESRAAAHKTADSSEPASMWTRSVVLPSVGISLFLVFYVTRVGFLVLYFATTFAYTTSKANGLATWYWVANAVALVLTGVLSDKIRVRKPFMMLGALISLASLAAFAAWATRPSTSYAEFAVLLVLLAVGGAMVNNAWLTMFSETVERINPAAVARGTAVYGAVLRASVTVILVGFLLTVSAAGVLADHGREVVRISTADEAGLAALAKVPPAVSAQLRTHPQDAASRTKALIALSGLPEPVVSAAVTTPGPLGAGLQADQRSALTDAQQRLTMALAVPVSDLTYLQKHGAQVKQAAKESPHEWQRWWWICFLAQLAFLPLGLTMRGTWSPRLAELKARERAESSERELAALHAEG